uniref:Uncharacterized protein n=1 Tax=Rhizophora mucronata TaxID=61149 RepID=A0A2P2LB02_RHIMU
MKCHFLGKRHGGLGRVAAAGRFEREREGRGTGRVELVSIFSVGWLFNLCCF